MTPRQNDFSPRPAPALLALALAAALAAVACAPVTTRAPAVQTTPTTSPAYALVFRNGLIYDGSGTEPFPGDVAMRDGNIVAVGPDLSGRGAREIDVHGQAIAPGFIKPAPRHAWCRVRKAARAFPINVFLDDATTDQRMQRGMKPRKLAHEFRNGLDDDSKPGQAAHG